MGQVSSQADATGAFQATLEQYHFDAVENGALPCGMLELPDTAVDATLLTLAAGKSHWLASVFGDGVVVAAADTGRLEVTVVSYLGGYPYYPNYLADSGRKRALLCHKDNGRQVETFVITPDGAVENRKCEKFAMDAPSSVFYGGMADYAWVAVLSDGIHSLTHRCEDVTALLAPMHRSPCRCAYGTAGVQESARTVCSAAHAAF